MIHSAIEIHEEIQNNLKEVYKISDTVCGLMYGCVKIFQSYRINREEFLDLLKKTENGGNRDLEFVISLFSDEKELKNFIRCNQESIENYREPPSPLDEKFLEKKPDRFNLPSDK